MESRSSAVLGSGDWVMYDGGEHQVVALAGTSVRLRSAGGTDTVVLAAYLMASPGSAVVDGASAPTVEPFGLLDALPDAVIDAARVWEQYVVEVQTGLPPGAVVGAAPRPGYDPATTTVMQRDQGKAAELLGINQPKVSALSKYRLEGFSVERLMRFLTALNQDIEIIIRNKPRTGRPGRVSVTAA